MIKIKFSILKNIQKYFVDKYYDEVCSVDNHHPFFEINECVINSKNDYTETTVSISINVLKWVREFIESKQDYDKLSWYDDFYYKIKNILNGIMH